jgi:hypothetical protein
MQTGGSSPFDWITEFTGLTGVKKLLSERFLPVAYGYGPVKKSFKRYPRCEKNRGFYRK